MQQQYFYELADDITKRLLGSEIFTAWVSAEASDFCRLNDAKVRQAGSVRQATLSLRLINGAKNAEAAVGLCLVKQEDCARLDHLLRTLRDQLAQLPDDPYLMYATDLQSSEHIMASRLPDSGEVIEDLTSHAKNKDLVGIYASGGIYRGFANSLGQRNWYETYSFNLDWSLYLRADKAVKCAYAGFEWDDAVFVRKFDDATRQLAVLERAPRIVKPGHYRVYLAPAAMHEVTELLSWGGFSLKAHKTKQTPLLRMVETGMRMHTSVTVIENMKSGLAPQFDASGYTKPDQVKLISNGVFGECLVSPRSAKEYGIATNGANAGEAPVSLEIAAGNLAATDIAAQIGEGLYVNNLWYLNFSDKPACRVTGMTRFASFWVEGGKIVAPVDVMRFDESLLRMLGDKLDQLTSERELILNAGTYDERQTGCAHLPGALVNDFALTL